MKVNDKGVELSCYEGNHNGQSLVAVKLMILGEA